MTDREKLERLARERLADISMQPEDWAVLVPQIERVLSIVAELERFPMDDAEPAPIFDPSGTRSRRADRRPSSRPARRSGGGPAGLPSPRSSGSGSRAPVSRPAGRPRARRRR